MPRPRPLSRFVFARTVAGALLTLLAWACTSSTTDSRLTAPSEPSPAKGGAGVSVSSTKPTYGDRGTTIDVHVIGSGFGTDAQATWLLHGVADPARVRTNSTTYVSSSEVIANITISADADLAFWDVSIRSGGKNGVGSELFEITTAEYVTTANSVNAVNESGQIVGTSLYDGAYIYDPSFGMKLFGSGQGWGLDPFGAMAFGRTSGLATAWVRQGTTSNYIPVTLPAAPTGNGQGNASSAARDALGTLIVGGWQTMPTAKGATPINRAAIWRYDGSWSTPTLLAMPAGASTAGVNRPGFGGDSVS